MASKKNEKTSFSLWDYNPNNTSNTNQIKKTSIKSNSNNLKPVIHLEKQPIENKLKNNQIVIKREPIIVKLEENQSMKKRSAKKKITKWDSDSDDCEDNKSIPIIKSNDSPKYSDSDSDENDSTLISFKPVNNIGKKTKKVTFWDSD
jgi:hypothetical protein